jgi:hypothetical protein
MIKVLNIESKKKEHTDLNANNRRNQLKQYTQKLNPWIEEYTVY